jgi:hypothetical protein
MASANRISRSFRLLTLAMAVPLVAIVAFVAYDRYVKDDGPGDGWKTYRNDRFKYEIRLPPGWEPERESGGEVEPGVTTLHSIYVDRLAPDEPYPVSSAEPPPKRAPRITVWVNPRGDWCTSTKGVTTTDIEVGGVKGQELICILAGPVADYCTPKPKCTDVPWGIMRDFNHHGDRVWVFGDVYVPTDENAMAHYETLRKAVQSFRFVD